MSDITVEMRFDRPQSIASAETIRVLKDNPTFMKSTADVVLISSDDVVFRVHKIILAEASSFFETMFTLPQPTRSDITSGKHDLNREESLGLPAIYMTERGDVLESLLRLCYPIDDPMFLDAGDVGRVLAAATKYEMQEAVKITNQRLRGFISATPLRVYAIACLHFLEGVASAAAKEVLKSKGYSRDSVPPITYLLDMEDISAGAYYRLVAYCRCNGEVAANFTFCGVSTVASPAAADSKDVKRAIQDPALEFLNKQLPDPDIVLRSSDSVDFPVHGIILRIASPILGAEVSKVLAQSLPPRPQSPVHGATTAWAAVSSPRQANLPVIELAESCQTLSILLQLLYPIFNPPSPALDDIPALLASAQQYKVDKAFQFAATALDAALHTQPLRVYFIASRFGHSHRRLSSLVARAAQSTLGHDIMETFYTEMEGSPALQYFRLLTYHDDCYNAAVASIIDRGQIAPKLKHAVEGPCMMKSFWTGQQPCWLPVYLEEVKSIIKENPAGTAVAASTTVLLNTMQTKLEIHKTLWCEHCRSMDFNDPMMVLSEVIAKEIDEAVGRVSLQSCSVLRSLADGREK